MVPIYGISTYISLVSLNAAFYVDTFRDIYEGFVIYAFFNLLINKLGGERALIIMLHSRPPSQNFFPGSLWSRDIYVGDPYTFLFVKRGILQFVYVKPILAIVTMVLKWIGYYKEGEFAWTSAYLYITIIYNFSVCLSLWCLMVFFYATKHDLVGFRPFPKFLCVKAIIFFSWWQSVIIALLVSTGAIRDDGPEHISVAIQDFLICMEMVPFAIAHSFAFSFEDYYDPNVHSARMPMFTAIKDSFGIKDVLMDTLDTFRGSKFNYKSFEPSEGVPHIGSSRTSRIMAGLRYSSSTSKKHWLEPAPASKFLSTGRGINDEVVVEAAEQLVFEDPDPHDPVERLYQSSRSMQFGDYNYPVIDFRAPLWRQYRRHKRRDNYGGTHQQSAKQRWLERITHGGAMDTPAMEPRDGCIDVIVERGKGNYVVLDTSSSSSFSSDDEDRDKPTASLLRPSTSTATSTRRPQPTPSTSASLSTTATPTQHPSYAPVASTAAVTAPDSSAIASTSSAAMASNARHVSSSSSPHGRASFVPSTSHESSIPSTSYMSAAPSWPSSSFQPGTTMSSATHTSAPRYPVIDYNDDPQDDVFLTSNVWK
ncbi:organic solute transporter Ostalpha-domain-containing protein [Gongronella butleri]|nr:organic solute transporter Ostalpha-domain-containing protein [Gongronella butleri]